LRAGMHEMAVAAGSYKGAPFAMIADMRDLVPLSPKAAAVLGEAIAFGRKAGVVVCAHLSSSGIIRLQANRVAREATPGQAGNYDVVSMDEAWKLTGEAFAAKVA
ncbi:MAG TPA: hypothetical protein VF407_15545, partial [Polyangiaceae bacterium]